MADVRDFIDRLVKAGKSGSCSNDTAKDITVCIDGKPRTVKPGQSTPKGADCDGVVHDDGSATKIHGVTRIPEQKTKEWVKENWPACAEPRSSGNSSRHQ